VPTLPQIVGNARRASVSWLLLRGGCGRAVRLHAEAVNVRFAGIFGSAGAVLEASPDGERFHAITTERRSEGGELIVLPPRWLRARAIGGDDETAIVARIVARLRG
jgi:hypothetical protein